MSPPSLANIAPKRTRTGCQTCRRRRKRCDEKHPICTGCNKLGLQCVYDIPLRWGLTRDPFVESKHEHSKQYASRPTDELDQVLRSIRTTSKLREIIYSTLDSSERKILLKFLTSGYRTLTSDLRLDDDFLTCHTGFPICEHSHACLLTCVTYQVSIDPLYAPLFQWHYTRTLEQFRSEICDPVAMKEGSLFFAGTFMCVISFNRLLPWTTHLTSLISLVENWANTIHLSLDKELIRFISTLGFLDLPSHCLNRKTPIRHLWRQYCQGQSGINEVSGLPCSLMDLLSQVDEPGIDSNFLSWRMPVCEPARKHLWEATRFAGITCSLERSKRSNSSSPASDSAVISRSHLVASILSSIRQCISSIPPSLSHFRQALLFPLVMAASQRVFLDNTAKDFIYRKIHELASERNFYHYEGVLSVVGEFWASRDEGIEKTARRMDIELALV